mmetsp:Transcript_56147/g.136018  ORF Transcript_56147/g.136018 Transcript_56147/m.136018 type:complete len:485 (-) Transcript_56147:3-1457(-)
MDINIDTDIVFHLALCALYISFNFLWFWTVVALLGSVFLTTTTTTATAVELEATTEGTETTTTPTATNCYNYLVLTARTMCRTLIVIQIIDMIVPFEQRNLQSIFVGSSNTKKDKDDDISKASSNRGSGCKTDDQQQQQQHAPPPGYWPWFAKLTDNTEGLKKYNGLEVIVEGDNDNDDDGDNDDPKKKESQQADDDKKGDVKDESTNNTDDDGANEAPRNSRSGGGNSTTLYSRDRNYLLCYFPHSLYGAAIFPLRRYFQTHHDGMTLLYTGADVLFRVPILGRFMTWWGLTKVSKHALMANLKMRHPYNMIMIQPDGIQGMFYGLDHEQIVLQKRKGFCKVALQTGSPLVPCYVMGVNQLYNRRFGPTSKAARLSHKLHMSLLFWTDRFGIPFGFVPNPVKMIAVVGKPIDVAKTENPTNEQVVELHTKFVTELKGLFDRHKHRMGSEWARKHDTLYLEDEPIPAPSSPSPPPTSPSSKKHQ